MDALTELAANLRRHIRTTVTDPFVREVELLVLDIEINRARCAAGSLRQTPSVLQSAADRSTEVQPQ